MKKLLVFLLPLVMLAACQPKGEKVPAIDLTDMDLTVSPGDDFYQYANGGWIAKNPLKPEYASFGSFDVLRENNVTRLNDLFAEMSEMSPKAGTVDQKIVDLYKQGLDSVRLNAEGGQPLQKYLDQLYAVSDKAGLAAELADENKYGEGGFFSVGVQADLMDSQVQILYLGQGGLGMGDRDYYVDPANADLLKGYTDMLTKLFSLSGYEDAAQKAANAVKIENQLAEISWTSVQNRDYTKQYNPLSTADICARWTTAPSSSSSASPSRTRSSCSSSPTSTDSTGSSPQHPSTSSRTTWQPACSTAQPEAFLTHTTTPRSTSSAPR